MTPEQLITLGNEIELEVQLRKVNADSQEQWIALRELLDAARYLHSAAAHLTLHDQKYGVSS